METAIVGVTYLLGVAYLIEWAIASGKCKEKWIMLTPLWFFMHSSFEPGVEGNRRRAMIYVLIALVLTAVYASLYW